MGHAPPILYQDEHLLVINKPPGVPVHAGSGGGANLEDFFHHYQNNAKHPPHLAHRLDRDTSGCLILGRTKNALKILGRLFEQKRIQKTYWAIVHGAPPEKHGRINLPMAKITDDPRRWHMQIDENGQPAITDYKILKTFGDKTLLTLAPKTGRTHQLRVHCQALGCPIIGDGFYGVEGDAAPLMLHARSLVIPFTHGQPPLTVEAPPPPHFARVLDEMGFGF